MTTTWIVTGSSVGLGRAIVEAALAAGNNVVGTARRPETLADLGKRYPDRFMALKLDVSNANQARAAADAAVVRFGAIDVLVNNAGFSGVSSIEDIPIDLIEEQMATNFMGAVHLCKAVLPPMRAAGRGRIILISSIGARIATAGAGIYYASKAAVSAFAESLALEVGPLGIKVTALEPGAMRTRFAQAESMRVAPFNSAYEATVGATVKMMRSSDFASIALDPAGHAAIVLKLAELDDVPVRLLAGADSYEWGTRSDTQRLTADAKWASLSRSAN